jgi:hypothetical protein
MIGTLLNSRMALHTWRPSMSGIIKSKMTAWGCFSRTLWIASRAKFAVRTWKPCVRSSMAVNSVMAMSSSTDNTLIYTSTSLRLLCFIIPPFYFATDLQNNKLNFHDICTDGKVTFCKNKVFCGTNACGKLTGKWIFSQIQSSIFGVRHEKMGLFF